MRTSWVNVAIVGASVACGSGTNAPDAGSDAAQGLVWTPCGAYECSTVEVPSDDIDPANGTIGLRVLRATARVPAQRIGTLVFIVGGPGISGVSVAGPILGDLAPRMPDVADRFDILFYERRGAGGGLTCIDDAWVDDYRATAPDPSTPAEWAAVDDLWLRFSAGCAAEAYVLPTLSSDTEARDIDRIRVALGEDTISFYAVSGGTLAGTGYSTLFPAQLRAGVFDSPLAPAGPYFATFAHQADAMEAALDAFFADCGGDPTCTFHGGEGASAVAAAYDALSDSLATPLNVGGRPVGRFDLDYALQALLAGTGGELGTLRDPLAALLASAAAGDGQDILTVGDPWWYRTGTGYDVGLWSVSLSIFLGDQSCPPGFDVAAAQALWPAVAADPPRMGPGLFNFALSCLHWPAPRATAAAIAPAVAPVLVVAGTHDLNVGGVAAATSTVMALGSMARLVSRDGYGHEQWLRSPCAAATESAFLVDPSTWVSPPGFVCAGGT